MFVQFLAIIVFLIVNMRSLTHIVKQLFMKIVIETKCSTFVPRKSTFILRRSAQDLRFASRGIARAKTFTWTRCAELTRAAFRAAIAR